VNSNAFDKPNLPSEPLRDLTKEELSAYEEDGATVVRGVLPSPWISYMRELIEEILTDPPPTALDQNLDGTARFFNATFIWHFNKKMRHYSLSSPLPQIAAQVMRSKSARLFDDQLLVKEPGTPARVPWHTDVAYWPFAGTQAISLWVPFDEVGPDNGVVEYVRGSHKLGGMFKGIPFTDREDEKKSQQEMFNSWGAGDYPEVPRDIESDRYERLTWELAPGDLILHHPAVIHGSKANSSTTKRRRAVATRYGGDDLRFMGSRNGATATMFDMISSTVGPVGLADGDPLSGRYFPLAWPRGPAHQT